jgi:hypothetical protein
MDRVTADKSKELMGLPLRSHLMGLASHTNRRQMVGECAR